MSINLANKTELLNYLKSNNLWAKKGLSQNFLVDREALDKIVEAAEIKGSDLIIEVGAGVGTLTVELVKRGSEVIAIELDNKLAELLNCSIVQLLGSVTSNSAIQQFSNEKLKVINADILKINLEELIGNRKYKVVANIPYAITSKILELFLSRNHKPEAMVMLVQKEVAERICASPRPENGRGKPGAMSTLSVSVQLYGRPEIVDIVKAESFFPAPKVDSAILRISNITTGHPEFISGSQKIPDQVRNDNVFDEKTFFRCVHIGFASRRKTLLNNLSVGYQLDKEKVLAILKSVGLGENVRAQELSVEEWKKLSSVIGKR